MVKVNHGEIIQKGTHSELINQAGIYKEFVNIRTKSEGWRIDKYLR